MSSKYRPPAYAGSTTMANPMIHGNLVAGGTVYVSSYGSSSSAVTPGGTTTAVLTHQHLLQIIQSQKLMIASQASAHPTLISSRKTSSPLFVNTGIYQNYGNDSSGDLLSSRDLHLSDGQEYNITLPDGTRIEVKADGSFEVIDKDATVKYRACRVREFNPFLNASDKLEAFIRFCGTVGVRQSEVLRLPIELFISWLIIEAARQDNEPEPDIPLIPKLKSRALPRCTACGRFMSRLKRAKKLEFCAPKCFEIQYKRALA